MVKLEIDKKLFVVLFIGSILLAIFGIVSHEFSHYLAARMVGFNDAHMSYSFTNFGIENGQNDYRVGSQYPSEKESIRKIIALAAGPLETYIVGTLGFILLIAYRRKRQTTDFSVSHWFFTVLSLLWLRPVMRAGAVLNSLSVGLIRTNFGDESKIASYFGWNNTLVLVILALWGLGVFFVVTFKYVPVSKRLTFLFAVFIGLSIGSWLWLDKLGPSVLP